MKDHRVSRWGLYVHIPFCQARCTYCDFNTVTGMVEADHRRYTDALLAEWRDEALPEGSLVSVFFGGGTPSLVAPELLAGVLCAVQERLKQSLTDVEVTMEANPGTVTAEKLAVLRSAGVNRLSIGAQARQNHHLLSLNRIHDVRAIDETVVMARAAGYTNINLDAIYGLPEQSQAEWEETVEGLLALKPDHLSLYALTVERGTPLKIRVDKGEAVLPDEDMVATMAEWGEARLVQAGLFPYEISNYARPGFESRHNRLYWDLDPYVALGAGSHAYAFGRRWWNYRGVRRYMAMALDGRDVTEGQETLTVVEEMREFLWLGLRQRPGVSRSRFSARFGRDPMEFFATPLKQFEEQGLLVIAPTGIHLTDRGRDLVNVVARGLVDAPAEASIQTG